MWSYDTICRWLSNGSTVAEHQVADKSFPHSFATRTTIISEYEVIFTFCVRFGNECELAQANTFITNLLVLGRKP
jgi:hypothetical protein